MNKIWHFFVQNRIFMTNLRRKIPMNEFIYLKANGNPLLSIL